MTRRRGVVLALVVVACIAATALYILRVERTTAGRGGSPVSFDPAELSAVLQQPHLLFRSTQQGPGYGHLSAVSLAAPSGARFATGLACERLDFAGGAGVCLTAHRGVMTTYSAVVFDASFDPQRSISLAGVPSRVRVSPDGRLAGITVFVQGDSYTQSGYSTRTTVLELSTGQIVANLEDLTVTRDGRPFKQADFNYWGVTFAHDSNTFYATLASGGVMYLVRGDAAARKAVVIAQGVECPSLSPDNKRIAFKRRALSGASLIFRLAVIDLSTGDQRVLEGESRSVDDQVEWLDDHRILYSTPDPQQPGSMIVSALPVDGGAPVEFVRAAYSPSVIGHGAANR